MIKLGSLAPADSPWDKALLKMALDWQAISKGRVTVKVYSGGIAGDEPDMLRKMRIGQLQAAAVSGSGLGKIHPDFLVYQLPFMARNDEELEYLFGRLRPRLEKLAEEKGFVFLAFNRSGWLHFFSKTKLLVPADMEKLKFFVMEGSPEVDQAWKEMGFHIVPLPANDAFAGAAERHGGCVHRLPALRRGHAVVRPGPQHDRLQLVALHRRAGDLQPGLEAHPGGAAPRAGPTAARRPSTA